MATGITNTTVRQANEHLDTIEDEYDVTIVLAVAHGSHAWGLHNEDSDYDIKAVYAPEKLAQYAKLGSHTETITRDFGEYEIEAWDVQKFADLLSSSNDQAIDVLRSPTVYRERVPRDEMRSFIEDAYNPMALYHKYRSIAKNNYRKYLSDHLVSNRNNAYPIREEQDDGYLVFNEHTETELFVPVRVVDNDEEFIDLPFEDVDTSDTNHTRCPDCGGHPEMLPTTFETTQTRRTVKRNLAVMRATMYARYLKYTGETRTHMLPHVEFPTFLEKQAPVAFDDDVIETAKDLIERKRNGSNDVIGDRVGREFAHPAEGIDPEIHVTSPPDKERINEFLDELLTVTGAYDST